MAATAVGSVDPGPELRRLQHLVLSGEIDRGPTRPAPAAVPEVHLPRRRGRLVGRERDLGEVAALLDGEDPVTVVDLAVAPG